MENFYNNLDCKVMAKHDNKENITVVEKAVT